MKRIGVLTAGGDAPGMNAAIRAVVRTALENDMSVIGFKRGYNGLLMRSCSDDEDFEILTARSVSDKVQRGGTFLMTGRCLDFLKEENRRLAVSNMRSLGLEGLVCIGGDGTLTGAASLHALGFPVVGLPGTIDNDLRYTDWTIGFDTAVNTALECVNKIRETSDSHERVSLVTVMGRSCGDIALMTALAGGAEIYMIPEEPWSFEDVAERVKWGVMRGKKSMIVIMAEGAHESCTSDIARIAAEHGELADISARAVTSSQAARVIEAISGHETRATVLGYVQRGGSPSARDRMLAAKLGAYAVELMRDGVSGVAVGIRGEKVISVPIGQIMEPRGDDPMADVGRLVRTMAVMTKK